MACHVLFVGGSPQHGPAELISGLAESCDCVIAVDGGGGLCREAGIVPDAWCGDEDSIDQADMEWMKERVATLELHPCVKDDTDLGLALKLAQRMIREQGLSDEPAGRFHPVLTAVSGGRPDHALGVLGLLCRWADHAPMVVEQGYQCLILSPDGRESWTMGEEARGRTFSAIPLTQASISIENMYWELDREVLPALSERGVSNWVTTGFARVSCHEGVLAAYLFW
ncbi:MAG: thiamine diphosphokinase [Atopobiaceae bacterium]|nr:thiamine diphosphokinase [Atopobiaceae bacterium]